MNNDILKRCLGIKIINIEEQFWRQNDIGWSALGIKIINIEE